MVAALIDPDLEGRWARSSLEDADLRAPHFMPVEVASVLRKAELRKRSLSSQEALAAFVELQALGATLYTFEPFAPRVWELRHTVTPYDAWYVALAEFLDAPLATLDRSLANAPGPTCRFEIPG